MRKLLGSVSVYFDPELDGSSFTKSIHPVKATEWPTELEIVVNTNSQRIGNAPQIPERAELQTLICHELGHFVAIITKEADQSPIVQSVNGQVPGEQTAWNLGEQIAPVDSSLKHWALDSYRESDAESEEHRAYIRDVIKPATLKLMAPKDRAQIESLFEQKFVPTGDALDRAWNTATADTWRGMFARLAIPACLLVLALACDAHASLRGDAVTDQFPSPIGSPADFGSLLAAVGIVGSVAVGRIFDRNAQAKPQPTEDPAKPDYSLEAWENEGGAYEA